ncbi:hypothetical protein FL966_11310 [Caproiciproducens galactitolivorans]|uniref:Uncharacterized protein n=1 Tax=Caproiciproducens galactitolivorans TaxID=642589 RepID=A0A4Z0YKE4_9FIRM|nr:hypothetical protein [Caproiciproducens galactitolivorans]QEY35594.1 hypothetical protein FL966_11310 [Caproiciproducens galactitolivorans]TGJ77322.1 hypothetical protein CAGA_06910 [Caproiciproducens galactitolivorans]
MSKKYTFPTNVNGISDDDTKKCNFITDANCIGQAEKNPDYKKDANTDTSSYQPNRVENKRNENDSWKTSPLEADTPIDPKTGSDKNR